MTAAVLGIDGGNSKADVVLVAADGTLLAAIRGRTISHQAIGLGPGMARLASLVHQATAAAGSGAERSGQAPIADVAVASLAGADYVPDIRLLTNAIEALGLSRRTVVVNDTIGALRAGAHRPWGVVLVCGQGVNAAAIAPDQRMARFPAVGDIAGDWGGGGSVGMAGLQAAIRGRDGRGQRTRLERTVPAHFGLTRPSAVTRAMYDGRIPDSRVGELCPVVFAAAEAGDAVARGIVDRLAAELVAMARALIRRLRISRLELEVVLAGGVFRALDPEFYAALERGICAVAPRATLIRLHWPPVAGAALLGLDILAGGEAGPDVAARLRASVGAWDREITNERGSGAPPQSGQGLPE
jgi:N-acetylglucosamine kinase-like BadF-type ATPase